MAAKIGLNRKMTFWTKIWRFNRQVNSLPTGKFFMLFCRLLIFFKINFLKNSFRNIIRMSNSLDPDQARRFVGPDLGQNCLPRLSADVTGKQRVNIEHKQIPKRYLNR